MQLCKLIYIYIYISIILHTYFSKKKVVEIMLKIISLILETKNWNKLVQIKKNYKKIIILT